VQDEISVVTNSYGDASAGNASFAEWCQSKMGIASAAELGCASWAACAPNPDTEVELPLEDAPVAPRLLYYAWNRFVHDAGIIHYKNITQQIQKWLPNAGIGANYSPTNFLTDPRDGQSYCISYTGSAFQWIRNFKEGGSTLPWSEVRAPPLRSSNINVRG
jgi:hypothetical protein